MMKENYSKKFIFKLALSSQVSTTNQLQNENAALKSSIKKLNAQINDNTRAPLPNK